MGNDPLEIVAFYTLLDQRVKDLSGTRTDGSALNLMRAASGIEMALWDLAGKALGVPTTTLLGGRFRQKVRVYDHAAPRNMLDKASCRDWAQKVKADPAGFTAHKFGFSHSDPNTDLARDTANRVLTTRELIQVRQGFENCREALGWDHDIMVHCHWEYDLRTAMQIAEAVEAVKPLWFGGPAAGGVLRGVIEALPERASPHLHGRESGTPAGLSRLHHPPRMRYLESGSAQYRRLPRNQANRRYGRRLPVAHR